MAIKDIENIHKPDILSCLANLSSDEVFTPPNIANDMLNLLPEELFKSPDTKFLDPCCKSGVFLREIAKRLIDGLRDKFPTLEECLEHIFKKQLFGISITELTGLLSRRSLYCSRNASGEFSIVHFDNEQGNIRFNRIEHEWNHGKCEVCGAPKSTYDRGEILETHAYEFIHMNKDRIKELTNMQFDVVIGNPPYQLNLGNDGGNKSKAKAIYHLFVSQAKHLNPKYLTMIIPSRWMTRTSEGIPQVWIDNMLNDSGIAELHDFENPLDCFPKETTLKGGVIYFLWRRDYQGKCAYYFHQKGKEVPLYRKGCLKPKFANIVIRNPMDNFIIQKIVNKEGAYYLTDNFSSLVSPKDFFTNKKLLTSSWDEYLLEKTNSHYIKCYINKMNHNVSYGWVSEEQIPLKNNNLKTIPLHKVFIPAAGGSGLDSQVIGTPFYGEPNSVCSQTYLVIGYDPVKHNFTQKQCENIISYIKTRFFRYLVRIKKKTQNGPRGVYQFVPLQDFNEPWNDEKLYKNYGLSSDEIAFIESMIKPME